MATVTELVREVALLVEREPRSQFAFSDRETGQLNDYATVYPSALEHETAELNDYTSYRLYGRTRETAVLNDLATPNILISRTARETATFNDRTNAGVRIPETVIDSAELNDSISGRADVILHEFGRLNDAIYSSNHPTRTVHEVARFNDRVITPTGINVREIGLLTSYDVYAVRSSLTVRELGSLASNIDEALISANTLKDSAKLVDRAQLVAQMTGSLRDTAYLIDTPVPPPYGRAYTCSIITWGMSFFSNFPFRTMAGKFAAGENLWRLDADDDYGRPIRSHITTGISDMGSPNMKHISAIYVAGESDSPITVSVTADVDGVKETYDYELELRDHNDYRNNRCAVGKGFRSRYIQVRIGGENINYRLLAVDADVAVSERRV